MKRLTLLMAALAAVFALTGCGQSGPLYVPGNPSKMAVPPSQDNADQEDNESDDGGDSSDSK